MKSYLKTKDFSVSQEEFDLLYDEDLDMLITQPVPKDLDSYYKSESYISHTDSRITLIDKIYQIVKKFSLWQKVNLIDTYVESPGTLLDIGAGTGDFLVSAINRKWIAEGIEPSNDARMRAQQKGVELNSDMSSLTDQKFKVITLWHVLEHLPNLENQIKKMISLLEKDGILVIAVPNFKSYDAEYYQNFWAAYDVPRHLWHFSRAAIEKLFLKHKMQIVKTKPMIFDAFYVSLLSEKYKFGKSNFIRAFWTGIRSNISAWRSKEYSSIIYILKKA